VDLVLARENGEYRRLAGREDGSQREGGQKVLVRARKVRPGRGTTGKVSRGEALFFFPPLFGARWGGRAAQKSKNEHGPSVAASGRNRKKADVGWVGCVKGGEKGGGVSSIAPWEEKRAGAATSQPAAVTRGEGGGTDSRRGLNVPRPPTPRPGAVTPPAPHAFDDYGGSRASARAAARGRARGAARRARESGLASTGLPQAADEGKSVTHSFRGVFGTSLFGEGDAARR
jgi:hypothetical protein